MQTIAVPLTPLNRLVGFFDDSFTKNAIRIILTPYIHLFMSTGLLGMNTDIKKAFTERSEVIWEEAKKRNIEMEQFVIFGKPVEQYRAKIDGKWQYFESLPTPPWYSSSAYNWIDDKGILKKKLEGAGVAVPKGKKVWTMSSAEKVFDNISHPVIVKPALGSRGRHTTTHIYTKEELREAYRIAKKLCAFVIVEEMLMGSVYRGTYVGGEIVGILRGDPPRVTGDGTSKLKTLIQEKNKRKHPKVKDVEVTPKLIEFIGRQGYTLESILPEGKVLDLSEKIGISYGGFSAEMIHETHPKILETLKKAGDLLKLPIVGFDFIVDNPTEDPTGKSWGIIEANSLPFINLHHFPLEGEPQNAAGKVWDLWNKK